MGEIARAVIAVMCALVLSPAILFSTTFIKSTFNDVLHAADLLPRAVAAVVLILNVGVPVALVMAPVIYNWDKHPLSSVAYGGTLLFLFLYRSTATSASSTPTSGIEGSAGEHAGTPPTEQDVHRCRHCGGPLSAGVCWSCGRRS